MVIPRYHSSSETLDAFARGHTEMDSTLRLPLEDRTLTKVFIGMQIIGWAGFTIILWTVFFAKTVRRHSTWINFCLCWLISCVSFVLLFLAGEQYNSDPTYALCLVQATLVYAAPPLTASATLCLVVHLWFNVRFVVLKFNPRHQRRRDILLFIFPYLPATIFFTGVLIYGLQHPHNVKLVESAMYCGIDSTFPGRASAIYVTLVLAATIGIEAIIATVLCRNWRAYTKNSRHSLAMIIRVTLFTLFGVIAIVSSLVYLSSTKHGAVSNIFSALLPVVSVIIFGSQLDVIRVWMFWTPKSEAQPLQHPILRPLLTSTVSSTDSLDSRISIDEPPLMVEAHHVPRSTIGQGRRLDPVLYSTSRTSMDRVPLRSSTI